MHQMSVSYHREAVASSQVQKTKCINTVTMTLDVRAAPFQNLLDAVDKVLSELYVEVRPHDRSQQLLVASVCRHVVRREQPPEIHRIHRVTATDVTIPYRAWLEDERGHAT